jgi:hypothetical protein
VLELHAIAIKKEEGAGRFAVAMTAQENERFLSQIHVDYKQYHSMLGRVNPETCECSRAEDRKSILEGIRRSVGFVKLSRMVFNVMEGWMVEQLQGQAGASAAAGNDKKAMDWNLTLAAVFLEQGRHDEAVVLCEAILKFRQLEVPENHPGIGVMWWCLLN